MHALKDYEWRQAKQNKSFIRVLTNQTAVWWLLLTAVTFCSGTASQHTTDIYSSSTNAVVMFALAQTARQRELTRSARSCQDCRLRDVYQECKTWGNSISRLKFQLTGHSFKWKHIVYAFPLWKGFVFTLQSFENIFCLGINTRNATNALGHQLVGIHPRATTLL